jgi:hypothetical protein
VPLNKGVLGALLRSRCVSGAKRPRVTPRTGECTEKGQNYCSPSSFEADFAAHGSLAPTTGAKVGLEPGIDHVPRQSEGLRPNPACHRDANQSPGVGANGPREVRGVRVPPERARKLRLKRPTQLRAERRPTRSTTPATRQRYSLWHLAGVEIRAFGDRNAGSLWWRLVFRAAILLSLVAYARRVHPSGQALCLLWLRPWRCVGGIAGLLLIVCTAGAISPVLGAVLVAAIAVVLGPCAISAVKLRPEWKELSRRTPPGRHVYVHSVASQLPGAGAQLLRALALEADENGWSMVLDASNEKLVRYYQQFGFVPRGPGVRMPHGARHVRMWRPPITLERGPLCGRAGYEAISTR